MLKEEKNTSIKKDEEEDERLTQAAQYEITDIVVLPNSQSELQDVEENRSHLET